MAIPKYDDMYRDCLEFLSDNRDHRNTEIRQALAERFHLTEEELKINLPSGQQSVFYNRVNWCSSCLKHAGLIQSPARATYRITEQGQKVLREHPHGIDNRVLEQFPSYRQFAHAGREKPDQEAENPSRPASRKEMAVIEDGQTPQDVLDEAFRQIQAALTEDVLSAVLDQTPEFFEHLVVRLLTEMGYGGSLEGAGTVTKISGDEGIDGIIREDKLGFNLIYIQAKRWDRERTVGRPEIQKFVGALAGQGAGKGLFITTAQFTKEARDYASRQHTTKIILVDGHELARLMIEYHVGVSVETTYAIKRIDSDFFEDLL